MCCQLCKTDSLVKKPEGTITDDVTLIRCSACGFSWREVVNKVIGTDIVTIKIIRNGN